MELSVKTAVGFCLAVMVGCAAFPVDGWTAGAAESRPAASASAARIEAALGKMRELGDARKWKELIEQFKEEDMAGWPPAFAAQAAEACNLRGNAYVSARDNERAEKDLTLALKLLPDACSWMALGDFYQRSLNDDQRALDAYAKAFEAYREEGTDRSRAWMPLSATVNAASILLGEAKYQEALDIMGRYDDGAIERMPPEWAASILRMYGRIYAGMGREEEALVKFRAAVELDKKQELEWTTPPEHPLPAPLGPWVFRVDRMNQGTREEWFAAGADTAEWAPVKVPAFWENTGLVGSYQGHAWYRTTFTVPAEWRGKTVRLLFSAVDEEAWVYVNGKLVREHSVKSEGRPVDELWQEPFTADVPPETLNYGQANVLTVRVNNTIAGGGIWLPVTGYAVDKK